MIITLEISPTLWGKSIVINPLAYPMIHFITFQYVSQKLVINILITLRVSNELSQARVRGVQVELVCQISISSSSSNSSHVKQLVKICFEFFVELRLKQDATSIPTSVTTSSMRALPSSRALSSSRDGLTRLHP